MTIGQVAKSAGVNIQTVRYYERRGLLPHVRRTASGYRQYDHAAIDRLRFIKRAQALAFSLEEIAELLALRVEHPTPCDAVEAKAKHTLAMIEQKVQELERMGEVLRRLISACERRQPTSRCPILEVLSQGGS